MNLQRRSLRWNMEFSVSNLVFLVLINLFLLKETECALRIRDLVVPSVVQNGTKSSIVLDCDYEFEGPSAKDGLVVKWFFNNNPTPVYQWIVGKKPQAFGLFKSKLNLNYRASPDEAKTYRAMQIMNPTIELSGEYMCLVSNFETEKSEVKKMTVLVEQKKINLVVDGTIDNKTEKVTKIRINCEVDDVYPEPELSIKMDGKVLSSKVDKDQNDTTDLYNIDAFVVLDVKTLKSPTVSFDCQLTIPEANYTANEYENYELDIFTTTTEVASTTTTTDWPTTSTTTDLPTTSTTDFSTTTDQIETTTEPGSVEEQRDEGAEDAASGLNLLGLPLLLLITMSIASSFGSL
uniref:Ig-like domain-containing protein n=1 Tax=Cacopsylla melanoneura TaxID=428564 RepID=A0A8D8RUH7_9HEMI